MRGLLIFLAVIALGAIAAGVFWKSEGEVIEKRYNEYEFWVPGIEPKFGPEVKTGEFIVRYQQGRVVEIEIPLPDGAKGTSTFWKFTYDRHGRIQKVVLSLCDFPDSKTLTDFRITYRVSKYTETGNAEKISIEGTANDMGKVDLNAVYQYDSNGRITSYTIYNQHIPLTRYDFIYKNGSLIREIKHDYVGKTTSASDLNDKLRKELATLDHSKLGLYNIMDIALYRKIREKK